MKGPNSGPTPAAPHWLSGHGGRGHGGVETEGYRQGQSDGWNLGRLAEGGASAGGCAAVPSSRELSPPNYGDRSTNGPPRRSEVREGAQCGIMSMDPRREHTVVNESAWLRIFVMDCHSSRVAAR